MNKSRCRNLPFEDQNLVFRALKEIKAGQLKIFYSERFFLNSNDEDI